MQHTLRKESFQRIGHCSIHEREDRSCSAVAHCCRLALLKVSSPFIGLLALIPNLSPGATAPILLLLLKVLGPLLVWLCAKLQVGEILDPPATRYYSSAPSAGCILNAGPVMLLL